MCDFVAEHSRGFTNHVNELHPDVEKYKCNHCDYASISKVAVYAHTRSKHLETKNEGRRCFAKC
jgi:hypothetical protein